ncbi:uncharacterized protein [Ptychodera flava]|uniref:uncharacterized protein n=1 Tax=Ptychodera flava TaxID=63121 RepID=UPI003969BBBD
MLDMVKLVHEIDDEDLPCFAAKDLSRLIAIDTTHVDVSTLMSELKFLRCEMAQLRDTTLRSEMSDLASEVQLIRQEMCDMKIAIVNFQKDEVSGAMLQQVENSIALIAAVEKPPNSHCSPDKDLQTHRITYAGVVRSHVSSVDIPKTRHPEQHPEIQPKNPEGEFTLVSRRSRRRPQPVIGTAKLDEDATIKSVRPNPPFKFFVTKFAPNTTPNYLNRYINGRYRVDIKCEQLKTKFDTYSSFLVETTRESAVKVRNPAIWPDGILIRRFY